MRQVFSVPACHSTAHGDTFLVINLLQQAEGEAFQPRHIIAGEAVGIVSASDNRVILSLSGSARRSFGDGQRLFASEGLRELASQVVDLARHHRRWLVQ